MRVCIDVTPPQLVSGKTLELVRGNCKKGSKTNYYLLKLKEVGLHSDPYNLTQNK